MGGCGASRGGRRGGARAGPGSAGSDHVGLDEEPTLRGEPTGGVAGWGSICGRGHHRGSDGNSTPVWQRRRSGYTHGRRLYRSIALRDRRRGGALCNRRRCRGRPSFIPRGDAPRPLRQHADDELVPIPDARGIEAGPHVQRRLAGPPPQLDALLGHPELRLSDEGAGQGRDERGRWHGHTDDGTSGKRAEDDDGGGGYGGSGNRRVLGRARGRRCIRNCHSSGGRWGSQGGGHSARGHRGRRSWHRTKSDTRRGGRGFHGALQ